MRTALVGLGDIGLRAHLPALLRHPDVELVALADPARERREQAARLATEGYGSRPGSTRCWQTSRWRPSCSRRRHG